MRLNLKTGFNKKALMRRKETFWIAYFKFVFSQPNQQIINMSSTQTKKAC